MNLNGLRSTSVRADQIGPMAKAGIVEGVIASFDCVFVADPNREPVAAVFLDLEGHFAVFVAFLLQGRLEQAEVVVVAFG